jgi:hypothetical protein
MIQVPVKLIAFEESVPATLAFVSNAPCLIVFRRVYTPAELPADTRVIVPTAEELRAADRESVLRLIEAARREGFEVVDDPRVAARPRHPS